MCYWSTTIGGVLIGRYLNGHFSADWYRRGCADLISDWDNKGYEAQDIGQALCAVVRLQRAQSTMWGVG